MRYLLVILLLCTVMLVGSLHEGPEKLPAAVYNPWFSYLMLKGLLATNPQLAAELLQNYPKGAPVQYHTLTGTAVHLSGGGPSSRLLDFKLRSHLFHKTNNFLNSQVSGIFDGTKSLAVRIATMAKPNLRTFVKYAKVELTPPMPTEIGQIGREVADIFKGATSGRWKEVTVRDAWLNALVMTEIGCWFFFGECIGKMHIVGYKIKE